MPDREFQPATVRLLGEAPAQLFGEAANAEKPPKSNSVRRADRPRPVCADKNRKAATS
jgi:hypothetical protein